MTSCLQPTLLNKVLKKHKVALRHARLLRNQAGGFQCGCMLYFLFNGEGGDTTFAGRRKLNQ